MRLTPRCIADIYFRYNHSVTLGSINFNSPSAGHFQVMASELHRHELYNPNTVVHDIALLKLPNPVTLTGICFYKSFFWSEYKIVKFSANIKLVALPPMYDSNKTFAGTLATLSGHGVTSQGG